MIPLIGSWEVVKGRIVSLCAAFCPSPFLCPLLCFSATVTELLCFACSLQGWNCKPESKFPSSCPALVTAETNTPTFSLCVNQLLYVFRISFILERIVSFCYPRIVSFLCLLSFSNFYYLQRAS